MLDADGDHIFDSGGPKGTTSLRHAVAGCLNTMSDSTLLFDPNGNSYDRLVPDAHAPTAICRRYENRTAAIRIPADRTAARRIKHRVARGDVNPYLMLAVILGAALNGIADAKEPPAPIKGNAYSQEELDQIPTTRADAIDAIETSKIMPRVFSRELIRNLVPTKRQEMLYLAARSDHEPLELYLDTV